MKGRSSGEEGGKNLHIKKEEMLDPRHKNGERKRGGEKRQLNIKPRGKRKRKRKTVKLKKKEKKNPKTKNKFIYIKKMELAQTDRNKRLLSDRPEREKTASVKGEGAKSPSTKE